MKAARVNIIKHILLIVAITGLLVLCIVYPFLPGTYDPMAVPLSTMAQVFGLVGLSLALVGLLWLLMPGRRLIFSIASLVIAVFVALIVTLFATLSVGNAFGILTFAVWVYIVTQLIRKVKHMKRSTARDFDAAPLYLMVLPILTLVFQLILEKPVTQWSRGRLISNATELIKDIEEYRTRHGHYPLSLQAQHRDYDPGVVGVEKYFYAPQGNGYNLSFEQPRFLMDRFGTREWIVYNPRDEHRAFSHAAAILARESFQGSQGWYESGEAGYLHWKYFLFD